MPSAFHFRTANLKDAAAIAALVNFVYRGESGSRSWTGEAHLLDGQRTDVSAVEDILKEQHSRILLASDESDRLIGCVHIKKTLEGCYLGMLTAHVDYQKQGLGSALVSEAERVAKAEFNSRKMHMTVISVRTELIDWYLRRGYVRTTETKPFPYGNERFGKPKREDLQFVVLEKDL